MKNDIFDIKRFATLAKLNITLNKKKNSVALGAVIGGLLIITTAMIYFGCSFDSLQNTISTISGIGIYIGAIIVASKAFENVNSSTKAISYLTIPSSTTEKYVWAWVSSLILYYGLTSIAFYSAANISNVVFALFNDTSFMAYHIPEDITQSPASTIISSFTSMVLAKHASFFLGSIYFKKAPLGKTILTGVVLNMFFSTLVIICIVFITSFGDIDNFENLSATSLHIDLSNPEELEHYAKYLNLAYLYPVILYTAAFFRLKEKEA